MNDNSDDCVFVGFKVPKLLNMSITDEGSVILRWRDFNKNFMPNIETLLYISDDDADLLFQTKLQQNEKRCQCNAVMKCQNLIFPNPLTIDIAKKAWNNGDVLHKAGRFTKYGNSSTVLFKEMKYKDIPLISRCNIVVHIDGKTRKPIPVCSKMRHEIDKVIKNMNEDDMKRFNETHKRLKIALNRMKEATIDNYKTILFEETSNLTAVDLDYNEHVTAAVYGAKIDGVLMKYIDDYYNGKLYVYEIGLLYHNEMKATRDNESKCNLSIYTYNKMNGEVIGDIKQNKTLCAQFRVVLKPLTAFSKL